MLDWKGELIILARWSKDTMCDAFGLQLSTNVYLGEVLGDRLETGGVFVSWS